MRRYQPQVFSTRWFKLHQRTLLWWANTLIGRIILGIPLKSRVVKLRPEMCAMTRDGIHYQAFIYAGKQYADRLYYALRPIWYFLHGLDMIGNVMHLQVNFGFDSLTIYANGTDGICSYLYATQADTAFSTIRSRSGDAAATGYVPNAVITAGQNSLFSKIQRGGMAFKISGLLPTGAKASAVSVSAGTCSVYVTYKGNTIGTTGLQLVVWTPSSVTNPAASDFATSHWGAAAASGMTYAGVSTSAYNAMSLNSNGISNIDLTKTHTGFGLMTSWDYANDTTGFTWSTYGTSYYYIGYTTNQWPKLALTYTVQPSPSLSNMTIAAAGIGYVFGNALLGGASITAYKLQIASAPTFASPVVDSGWVSKTVTVGNPLSLITSWGSPTEATWYARMGTQSTYYNDIYGTPISFVIHFPSIVSVIATQNRERLRVTVTVNDDYVEPPEVMVMVDQNAHKAELQ